MPRNQPKPTRPTALSVSGRVAAVLVLATALSGCMVNNAPKFEYGPDGEKIQFKRYEKHLDLNYVHNISPVVYTPATALPLSPMLSEEENEVLRVHGTPDYVRGEYLSESRETVTDWVYYEKDRIFQFVEGQLVYEDGLTDYDKTLIRRGRPSESLSPTNEVGHRLDILRYQNRITDKIDEYVFRNGQISGLLQN